jgi:hypothetical protein
MVSNMRCTWHYPADANMEHRATRGTVREIVDLEGYRKWSGNGPSRSSGLLHVSVYVLYSVTVAFRHLSL